MRYLKLCVYMYERLRLHSKVQFSHVARRGKIQLGKSKKTFEKNIRRKKTFDEKTKAKQKQIFFVRSVQHVKEIAKNLVRGLQSQ